MQDAGEKDAANSSFNECLAQYQAGKVAMWYDATVAAGLLEAADSPVKGKNGYALAPVNMTKASGWLWSWALAIPKSSPEPDGRLEVHRWATGPRLHQGGRHADQGRLGRDPARHARARPTQIPQYKKAAAAFAGEDPGCDEGGADQQPRHDASAPGCPACSTSASRSSRMSATSAPQLVLERDRRRRRAKTRALSQCQQNRL